MKIKLPFKKKILILHLILLCLTLISAGLLVYLGSSKLSNLKTSLNNLVSQKNDLSARLTSSLDELNNLKNQDQFVVNQQLKTEIKNIHDVYLKTVNSYESVLSLKDLGVKNVKLDELIAQALKFLADKNYASADASLKKLDNLISQEKSKLIPVVKVDQSVAQSNTPPGSGYQRQRVSVDGSEFIVDIVSADLNSTRVIVDSASDSTCTNDCPVMALGDYVSRSSAFAGVNGSYFCPSTYPQCAGKTNSFDTLLMNKNKVYFNSDNNVYSTVPAVIFTGSSARFVQKSLEWGRDTSIDAVIANQPLLILNNSIVFGGDSDAKHSNKGGRSFVGASGSTVYIGVVRNATVAESAKVLHVLGVQNALNLDDGGSTALWSGGYKIGPGRNIPNAVLFVKK